MTQINEAQFLNQVKQNAQQWLDAFSLSGKHNIKEIQKCLKSRTFEGKPVEVIIAVSPSDAMEKMAAWAKKQKDTKQIKKVFSDAHNCIWDYYMMAYYESACSELPDKSFEGAEFIYQSLLPAFKAGLGYIINLGSLIIGVCLPEAYQDEQQRIHRAEGPAIIWGEHKEYWWHGVKVEPEWIENPDSIDVALCITHNNIEQRRALCEIVGWDKVIDNLNPKVIDTDSDEQIGTLLEVDLPDHGKQRFLRVEELSTGRRFCIMTSNNVPTALDAQAEINQIPKDLFKMGYVRS